MQAGLTGLEQQLSSIAAAATRAAERACAGGRVWALSDEEGFVSELQHRASGLMMVRGIPGGDTFEMDDAVSQERETWSWRPRRTAPPSGRGRCSTDSPSAAWR